MKPDRPSKLSSGARPAPRRQEAIGEAKKLIRDGHPSRVLALLQPFERKARHDAELLHLLAIGYDSVMATKEARACAERSHKLSPHPQTLLIVARSHRVEGNSDRAVAMCDDVIAKFPKMAELAMLMKAGALEESGQFDAARAVAAPLLEETTLGPTVHRGIRFEWAKLLIHEKRYDEAITLLDELLESPETNTESRRGYLYLKAKACDRNKDFAAAFEAAASANEIGKLPFDPDLYTEQVSILMENWSREALPRFPLADCPKELPVFVAGMPRSGTSLIDQIIDAHPKAAGVGELADIETFATNMSIAYDADLPAPACFGPFDNTAFTRAAAKYVHQCRNLSPPGTERVVNKALGNNKLVGLLARLFPRARVIHAVRDPRDVAISCFMGGFNNRLHAWTTQIDWASHAWAQSERMMQHWKTTLDIPILDVHYEALVADPENQFRRIIEFIGLPWDDACLSFHKSRRTVRTLSYDQVNRPIYKTSSGRHANYASFIKDIEFPAYAVPCGPRV